MTTDSKRQKKADQGYSRKTLKTIVMYLTMVAVSTLAIYFLEHSTIFNAIRTALVAAIAKTFAANWVSDLFNV